MLLGTPAWEANAKPKSAPAVSLMQAVHFTDAKRQDVVVGTGRYRIEVAGKSGLRLTPVDGHTPIVVEGHASPVKVPVALSVPVNENEHHLVLLLPEGKAVDLVGSPSGVTSRSGFLPFIEAQKAKAQLIAEEAGDIGNPPPSSPAVETIEHPEKAGPIGSEATIGSAVVRGMTVSLGHIRAINGPQPVKKGCGKRSIGRCRMS